jgi:hypothetical protein
MLVSDRIQMLAVSVKRTWPKGVRLQQWLDQLVQPVGIAPRMLCNADRLQGTMRGEEGEVQAPF